MKPSQEYLDSIAKKLESLRSMDPNPVHQKDNIEQYEPKIGNIMDQMGITAMKYLEDKKKGLC